MTKNSKIDFTDEQLDRLVDALDASDPDVDDLLAEPDVDESDGNALSDDDAISYALDALHGQDLHRIEMLLASSSEAREEMTWLRREAEAWKGPAGEARVRAVARSIVWRAMPLRTVVNRLRQAAARGFGRLALVFQDKVPLAQAIGAMKTIAHGETDDGLVRWEIVRGEQENSLTVRLASWATNLSGTTVRLRAGTWEADCVLAPVGPREVGAEATIVAEERAKVGDAAPPVSLEIVEGAGNVPRET